MKSLKYELFIYFCILSFVINTRPPVPDKMYEIKVETPSVMKKSTNKPVSFKRLDNIQATLEIENSKLVTNFYEDYKIEQHELTVIPKNLPDGYMLTSYILSFTDKNKFEDIEVTCQIEGGTTNNNCSAEIQGGQETKGDDVYNKYTFSFTFKLFNGQRLIINHSQKIIKTKRQILYKTESIRIPLISGTKSCDYKYNIIPDGYKFLGFSYNNLTKVNDKEFIYSRDCSTESKTDIIRYAPEQIMWKAHIGSYLTLETNFKNDIEMIFPRYYRGGKNEISYYRIFSTQNKEFKEEKVLYNYTSLYVKVPAANTKKLGVDLYTAFTNKLSNRFDINIPQNFYAINNENINTEIKNKAEQLIGDENYYPGKPNYYKLGQFVYNHIKYDLNEFGKDYTAKQIYDRKTGVCEHYTILYNEMLNAIGIKTLYLTGWAFQNDETSGNTQTVGHAWTAALIDGNWIELDATWGLFEGIPAGHILKTFYGKGTSYSWNEGREIEPTFNEERTIEMITNEEGLIDPYPEQEDDEPDEDSTESKDNEDSTESKDKDNEDSTESKDKDNEDSESKDEVISSNKSYFGKTSLLSLILLYLFYFN